MDKPQRLNILQIMYPILVYAEKQSWLSVWLMFRENHLSEWCVWLKMAVEWYILQYSTTLSKKKKIYQAWN